MAAIVVDDHFAIDIKLGCVIRVEEERRLAGLRDAKGGIVSNRYIALATRRSDIEKGRAQGTITGWLSRCKIRNVVSIAGVGHPADIREVGVCNRIPVTAPAVGCL